MSKRSLDLLVWIVVLGLIAGIIGYFVSASFQAWVSTWLGNPVGLAASATTVAALATLLAVVVGLRGIYVGRALANAAYKQTERALAEGRRQFLETQYNASRPLLIPVAPELQEQYELEEPLTLEWNATSFFVTIQNVGTGVATNIWIAMLPPAPLPDSTAQYASRLGSPLPFGSDPVKVYLGQGVTLFRESDSLNQYPLALPPDQAGSIQRADRFIARLSITYQDIFGRKHASIFDFSDRGVWVNVAFLTTIEHDLGDIAAAKERTRVTAPAEV